MGPARALASSSLSRPDLGVLSRKKSKQALRDYKKVQIQLENLESSVRDRCKKEFTGEAAEKGSQAPGLCPSLLL